MQFKWAVCQHPMTLIIKEDETCLERNPPYGAESFHAYYLKIKENLDYLKTHEFAKVCFETSILETLFILDSYPEMVKEFADLVRSGRLSFVGGTYGQVHTQTLTSESNYRQFEAGLKKYKELFGINISLYAVQEPGHHEQMPQLLKAFNIKFASLPTFTYSLIFLEEYELVSFMEMAWMKFTEERGMEQDQITRICFTNNNEFAMWKGLDNTEIPLYLIDPMRWCRREDIRNEYKKDLYASPVVRLYLTDLLDFNPEIISETLEHAQFELADAAIAERFKKTGKGPKVRLYSYYSYLEGSNGDNAYVKNRYLENLILGAQSLQSFLSLNRYPDIGNVDWDKVWKVLLETQHHDICYPDAPLLQKWAIKKIDECIQYLNPEMDRLKDLLVRYQSKKNEMNATDKGWIIDFNCLPHEITCVVKLKVPEELSKKLSGAISNDDLVLLDRDNNVIDCQVDHDGRDKYLVFVDNINGLGTNTLKFSISKPSSKQNDERSNVQLKKKQGLSKTVIDNDLYRCDVNRNGEIKSILIKGISRTKSCKNFKDDKKTIFKDWANRLSASFSDETPMKFKTKPEKFNHLRGSVYDLIEAEGVFDRSSYKREARFYRKIPRIDFKITFNFDNQQIGNFFLEETKLCVLWPIKDLKKIRHDIPFGSVKGQRSRPLYALNWINCELDNSASFTILPKGKIKFFEKDGLLYNLLAWGDEGVDFMRVGGTCAPEILKGHFDLSLNGPYSFEYSLYLHKDVPENSDLFKIAAAYSRPFIPVYSNIAVKLDENIIFKFNNRDIWTTSIFGKGKKVKCRFFECNGKKVKISLIKRKDISISEIKDILGNRIERLEPCRIAEMRISGF